MLTAGSMETGVPRQRASRAHSTGSPELTVSLSAVKALKMKFSFQSPCPCSVAYLISCHCLAVLPFPPWWPPFCPLIHQVRSYVISEPGPLFVSSFPCLPKSFTLRFQCHFFWKAYPGQVSILHPPNTPHLFSWHTCHNYDFKHICVIMCSMSASATTPLPP